MKVTDIIGDDSERKVIRLINHVRRKKKANPKANKTGPMSNFIDVFHGISGGGANGGSDASGGSIV